MKKPIAISLSPNTENSDVQLAIKLIFSLKNILQGKNIVTLERWFCHYFNVPFAISFANGRQALFAILKNMDIGEEDEVLLQAFTCVAVPYAIIATGAKPVYVDITESIAINIKDLEKRITEKTKAIVIQHTFGIPAEMLKIKQISQRYNIPVIEDCAHTIGEVYHDKHLGTFGDAAFFSFGRDKAFSSVFGGIAITANKTLGEKIQQFQNKQPYPGFFWTLQQVFHPVAFSFILPLYDFFSLGKVILIILQKLHLLSFPVSENEKQADTKNFSVEKFPNALASLALFQLRRIEEFNNKREKITSIYLQYIKQKYITIPYRKIIPFLRFPITVKDRDNLLITLRRRKIYPGLWYANVIDPKGTNLQKISYQRGSCPIAESVAKEIINLPCYPTMNIDDAKEITSLIHAFYVDN